MNKTDRLLAGIEEKVEGRRRQREHRRREAEEAEFAEGLALYLCVNLVAAGLGERLSEFAPPEALLPQDAWARASDWACCGPELGEVMPPAPTSIAEADLAVLRGGARVPLLERLAASFGDVPVDALPAEALRDLRRRQLAGREGAVPHPSGALNDELSENASETQGGAPESASRGVVRRAFGLPTDRYPYGGL